MSGAVGLFLSVLGWWLDPPAQKRAFAIAALMCIIVSTFVVWHAERKERLRLEREAGPNLLIKLDSKPVASDVIRLYSCGDEPPLHVTFSQSAHERIKAYVYPSSVAFVQMSEPTELKISFSEQLTLDVGTTRPLIEFFGSDFQELDLAVTFENAKGGRYRRLFHLRRPILHDEIQCFPEPREFVRKEVNTSKRSLMS